MSLTLADTQPGVEREWRPLAAGPDGTKAPDASHQPCSPDGGRRRAPGPKLPS
jgi:hypothetical protein